MTFCESVQRAIGARPRSGAPGAHRTAAWERCGLALLVVALGGCSVGPDYRAPKTVVPAQWTAPSTGGLTNRPPSLVKWWTTFQDGELDSLIERAVQSNYDLKIAEARVLEARALWKGVIWDLGPTGSAGASYTDAQRSQNALTFPINQLHTDMYDAQFDATWEIDIFGGKRRSLEGARARVAAVVEDRRDVLVSLLAEVARNYLGVRGVQERLVIARRNLEVQRQALDIARARFQAGLTSDLDVTRAAALLASTESQIPTLETSVRQGMHRLGVLVGQPPGALVTELDPPAPLPATPPEVPVGLPSDLLRRRPDVRRAERNLAAATADIGVATAELFPKFTLFGTAGFQSLSAGDWFTGGSKFWSAGPSVSWSIFDLGVNHAKVRAASAVQKQSLAAYQKAVLSAFEDAENALVSYAQEQARYRSLDQATAANRRALQLSNDLYRRGLVDFLNVLDTERSLYLVEDQLVQSRQSVRLNLVTLYKALGGGWESETGTKVTKP